MVTFIGVSCCVVAKPCPFMLIDDGIFPLEKDFSLGLKFWLKAPDQNRTDTSSLEGYGSTIELQAPRNILREKCNASSIFIKQEMKGAVVARSCFVIFLRF